MTRILGCAAALAASLLAVSAPAQPIIVVQDFGEAPREAIRYRFTPGATANATMTMGMQISMGGQQMPASAMPAVETPVTVRITEVRPDGSARYEYEVASPALAVGSGSDPALDQSLASSLSQAGGASGWYRMDARGNILEGSQTLAQDAALPAQAGQLLNDFQGQMQQLSAPFPAEAVGVGARWQATTTAVLMATPMTMTMDYTLLARDGDTVELGMTMVQAATAPAAPVAGIPAELQSALGAMRATGTGKLTVDLNSMVPKSEMTMSTSMSMAMPGRGQAPAQSMSTTMQITVAIAPE